MILLVEDDEDVRDMLELTLRLSGFEVELAADGTSALRALEQRRPCLMILDLVMPGIGGHGVLAQLRERGGDPIPVCVITALDGAEPEGVVGVLRKPLETARLLALAARYCPCRVAVAASPA